MCLCQAQMCLPTTKINHKFLPYLPLPDPDVQCHMWLSQKSSWNKIHHDTCMRAWCVVKTTGMCHSWHTCVGPVHMLCRSQIFLSQIQMWFCRTVICPDRFGNSPWYMYGACTYVESIPDFLEPEPYVSALNCPLSVSSPSWCVECFHLCIYFDPKIHHGKCMRRVRMLRQS